MRVGYVILIPQPTYFKVGLHNNILYCFFPQIDHCTVQWSLNYVLTEYRTSLQV
jgi:hypothetical protein